MILGTLRNALKSHLSGEYEITRLIGGIGGLSFIAGALFFEWWEVCHLGKTFDLVNFCIFFPGGIAALGGSTAGAAALKDRFTAGSQVIQETGAHPAQAVAVPVPVPTPPQARVVPLGTAAPAEEPATL